jgi:hypothetical protein
MTKTRRLAGLFVVGGRLQLGSIFVRGRRFWDVQPPAHQPPLEVLFCFQWPEVAKDVVGLLDRHRIGKFTGFSDLEPNSPVNDMPEGGPKKYAMAAESLKKLLSEI